MNAMPRRRVVGWVVWGRGEVDVGVVEQVRGMMAMATSAGIALSPTRFQVEAARDVWMRRSGSRRGHGHWWHEAWRPGNAPILSHAQVSLRVIDFSLHAFRAHFNPQSSFHASNFNRVMLEIIKNFKKKVYSAMSLCIGLIGRVFSCQLRISG
jgi:hypothetical protein